MRRGVAARWPWGSLVAQGEPLFSPWRASLWRLPPGEFSSEVSPNGSSPAELLREAPAVGAGRRRDAGSGALLENYWDRAAAGRAAAEEP